jgi:two-component system phosphate regulon response regulator OmpR
MSERILVVEDDPRLAAMLDEYLRNHGYAVSQAATGAQALEKLSAEAPDAIILDLMLPDMDGLDVCRKLRERSDLPVLMLTARGDAIDRIIGLEIGATCSRVYVPFCVDAWRQPPAHRKHGCSVS